MGHHLFSLPTNMNAQNSHIIFLSVQLYGSEVKSTMTPVKAAAHHNHVYKYRVGQRNLGAALKHNFSNSVFVAFDRTQVTIKKNFSGKYPTDPPSHQTFLHLTRKKNTHTVIPVNPWKIEFYN